MNVFCCNIKINTNDENALCMNIWKMHSENMFTARAFHKLISRCFAALSSYATSQSIMIVPLNPKRIPSTFQFSWQTFLLIRHIMKSWVWHNIIYVARLLSYIFFAKLWLYLNIIYWQEASLFVTFYDCGSGTNCSHSTLCEKLH